jgi:hypothetical protein
MRNELHTLWLLLLTLFTTQSVLSAEWPAKDFVLELREPTRAEESGGEPSSFSLGALFGQEPQAPSAVSLKANQWLGEIGTYYRRAGHDAPNLKPLINDGGVPKYRVFMFPYEGSRTRDGNTAGGSYFANTCFNQKIPWLAINDVSGGGLPSSNYWTMAHELMHALQFGDRLMDDCNLDPDWIVEGIADGAALYLMNKKIPGYSGRINRFSSSTGLRSYRLPLFWSSGEEEKSRLDKKTGYLTSSFWRFIAERFGGLKVFPHFLDKTIKKGAGREELLKWLDERLQTLEGIQPVVAGSNKRSGQDPPGLYEVYPAFISEFASYGGPRYTKFNWRDYATRERAREGWLNSAFVGCKEFLLTPEKKHQKMVVTVEKNAAICLRVRYEGFSGNITSQMELIDDRLDIVDQLHLGWAWKIGPNGEKNCYEERKKLKSKWPPCDYKAFSQTGPVAGKYVRTWPEEMLDFGTGTGKTAEYIFVLSNVAVKPWRTITLRARSLKISVSDSTANGEPTEPVEQMSVPRKRKAPLNPNKPVGKEELYGLQTDPPAPDRGIKGLTLNPYTPNRDKGAKARPGGYGISFHDLKYGETGPVTGIVALDADDPRTDEGPIASNFCKDPLKPIGEVIQSDEDSLRIAVDADLCQAGPSTLKQCEDSCPVVDHLSAEANIAFGWRQFSDTAPTDIRTPGVQRYINSMPSSLEEAMRFGAGTELPDTDGIADNAASTASNASTSGGTFESCTCTCEEREAFEVRALELKARLETGDNPSLSALDDLNRCNSVCQREYIICVLEADRAEKQRKELQKQQQQQSMAAECDCSCDALDALFKRGKDLEEQFMAGGSVSNEEIMRLSQCTTTCQQEMMACAMKN